LTTKALDYADWKTLVTMSEFELVLDAPCHQLWTRWAGPGYDVKLPIKRRAFQVLSRSWPL